MGKLKELLAAEADRFRSEKAKRQQSLGEWLGLLNDLFAQIDSWLKATDPEGLLEVTADTQTINDPALGEYQAPTRRVVLGDNSVEIVPRARYVVATLLLPGSEQPVRAHGLVEIRSLGWASYNLYQLPGGSGISSTSLKTCARTGTASSRSTRIASKLLSRACCDDNVRRRVELASRCCEWHEAPVPLGEVLGHFTLGARERVGRWGQEG